jgi:iron complex transport system permease protein
MVSPYKLVNSFTPLIIILLITFTLHICIGKYPLNPILITTLLIERLHGNTQHVVEDVVFFNVRLPRAIMAMLFGIVMGVTGTTLQSLLRNPLVSPYTLGISSGAAVGAALSLAFGFYGLSVEVSALLFSILAFFLTLSISKVRGGLSPISLVLAGIIISALFQGVLMLIQIIIDPTRLAGVVGWIAGRLNIVSWGDIFLSTPLALTGVLSLILLRWRTFILSLGDEEAKTLGVNVVRERIIIVVLTCISVSAVVAVAGIIGWVCLITPHLVRLIIGPDPKKLLPASVFVGASFLLTADTLAKSVWDFEIPVGIIATLIGAPLFLYLLRRSTYVYGG